MHLSLDSRNQIKSIKNSAEISQENQLEWLSWKSNGLASSYIGFRVDPVSDASRQGEPLPWTRRVDMILNIFVTDEDHSDLQLEELFQESHFDRFQWNEVAVQQLQLAAGFLLICATESDF